MRGCTEQCEQLQNLESKQKAHATHLDTDRPGITECPGIQWGKKYLIPGDFVRLPTDKVMISL